MWFVESTPHIAVATMMGTVAFRIWTFTFHGIMTVCRHVADAVDKLSDFDRDGNGCGGISGDVFNQPVNGFGK